MATQNADGNYPKNDRNVESPSADRMQGAPGPLAQDSEDGWKAMSDQDIDTAGTEADDLLSLTLR